MDKSQLGYLFCRIVPLDYCLRCFLFLVAPEDDDEPPSNPDSLSEWDEFGDSDYHKSEEELDSGSWRPIFESDTTSIAESGTESKAIYYSGNRGAACCLIFQLWTSN
ncbi:hypothetical protein K1719_004807 [Acacia pycnantha]|nr:hypothetical protein K1719_004807 [Acacia pycnantha]